MYCRQRRHLYYGGQIWKYYLAPSVYSIENPKSSLYCEMSMTHTPNISGMRNCVLLKEYKKINILTPRNQVENN
jgi:hypothetical protein